MRIRRADFVQIPMWVMEHPEVHGNCTRIAVYAGLRAISYESPDLEWRSTREVAKGVGEVIGMTDEACRKHLAALKAIGAILVHENGDISVPMDPPDLGTAVGTTVPTLGTEVPNLGTAVPNGTAHTSTSSRDIDIETRVAPSNVGTQTQTAALLVPSLFDAFWSAYPNKVGKPAARKAWSARKCDREAEAVMYGLHRWNEYWSWRQQPEYVPHPATWLNQRRWEDPTPPMTARRNGNGQPSMMEGLRAVEIGEDGWMPGMAPES